MSSYSEVALILLVKDYKELRDIIQHKESAEALFSLSKIYISEDPPYGKMLLFHWEYVKWVDWEYPCIDEMKKWFENKPYSLKIIGEELTDIREDFYLRCQLI